jgi:hypothetical protein
MPSNDINGQPICILGLQEVIELVNMVAIMVDDFDPAGWSTYNKLVEFVDDCSSP